MSANDRGEIQVGAPGPGGQRQFAAVDNGRVPSAESMRQLRRMHAAAVTAVTVACDGGFRGVTVSAFCIVSLAPPIVLICLTRDSEALTAVRKVGRFAVSILSDSQEFLAERFAGRAPLVNPRLEGVKHRLTRAGDAVLEECLVWFGCAVRSVVDAGDHAVVFGDVQEAGHGTGVEPLLYFDGRYRLLGVE